MTVAVADVILLDVKVNDDEDGAANVDDGGGGDATVG